VKTINMIFRIKGIWSKMRPSNDGCRRNKDIGRWREASI